MESAEESAQHAEMSDGDTVKPAYPSRPSGHRRGHRLLATVYDAVAGRVTYDGVLRDEGRDQKKLQAGVDQRSTRDNFNLPPEDVLFRRKDAPERYEEHDIYRAHERELPNGGKGFLPESDLLKAIHEYSSQFYGVLNRGEQQRLKGRRSVDERSMDETALLAFGILLEEAGREILGRRGHLVFTEGFDNDEDAGGDMAAQDPREVVDYQEVGSWRSGVKRRKVVTTKMSNGV